jgi:hypothetical protein
MATPGSRLGRKGVPRLQVVRDRIKVSQCLNRLDWIESQCIERYQQMDLGEVPALKLAADIVRYKLNKVLPDLKAVEHSGQVTTDVVLRFNP